ncbi:TSC-22 / Dip / Bun [Parasponia andersonii]|uniref:TSC-22 / Dip / Bun n=1 Tax=Parasponia andersonii TaxID=3476 RepID=A0A2P5AFB1_PARAD|nr:TSC-22 / Dip / Bun [Parasponia andersonii]
MAAAVEVEENSESLAPSPAQIAASKAAITLKAESPNSKDFIASVASNISSQPLQNYDPHVWGVLTAISNNARKRNQGINMILTADEHCIGRLVDDTRFQIDSNAVSAKHCKIYRKKVTNGDDKQTSGCHTAVFLKDTSTNGTFINWKKLQKKSPEAEVRHGDIISFAAPPQHEVAFAFVFREVLITPASTDGAVPKRKAEEFVTENKRQKGIGIGAPEGPISLDDFRSLQRSNTELRKQLENQVITIDKLHNENREVIERHENEMKEMKESISKSYADQLKELRHMLEVKQNELADINRISVEQKHAMEDLNERLSASVQSCNEANDIMNSQKASIAELKEQLDEERDQRREEREKAASDLKAALQRALSEAREELKRSSDAALRREREQQEVINKLQESERERCLLVETLRSKLEDTRQKLVISDTKVRQLETQVYEVQLTTESGKKRVEELELETKRLRNELESEKAAREEAWAKVSSLELEINAAMRDLDFERRRLKGARERIMLRETQLRAFYSTTEEISVLFAKQQEQLKAMQRTLEDEENYENTSIDIDLNLPIGQRNKNRDRDESTEYPTNRTAKAGSATSARHFEKIQVETSSDEASVTEKHDCDVGSQDGHQNTQEAEFTSATNHGVKGGFGSDIVGLGTAPIAEGEVIGTEQVPETESPGINEDQVVDLNKLSGTLHGDTMQLDEEADEQGQMSCQETLRHSQSHDPLENPKGMEVEDTEAGGTVRTQDLLASEVAGSWACSTVPSVDGDNESLGRDNNDNNDGGGTALHDSNLQVAESQSNPSTKAVAVRWNHERRALCEMIGIVAPDLKEQFGGRMSEDDNQQGGKQCSSSDSDTESCTDSDVNNKVGTKDASVSNSGTESSERADENDVMDDDEEATQEDCLG